MKNSTTSTWDENLRRSKTLRFSNALPVDKNNSLKKDSEIVSSVVSLDDGIDENILTFAEARTFFRASLLCSLVLVICAAFSKESCRTSFAC